MGNRRYAQVNLVLSLRIIKHEIAAGNRKQNAVSFVFYV